MGDDTEFVLIRVSITTNKDEQEMIASPSRCSGDVTLFFTENLKEPDVENEAETLCNASMANWDSLKIDEGDQWPIDITFRGFDGLVHVLWDGVLLSSWNEFAMESDLNVVFSHTLGQQQDVDIVDIEMDRQCENYTFSPTVNPTTGPTVTVTEEAKIGESKLSWKMWKC